MDINNINTLISTAMNAYSNFNFKIQYDDVESLVNDIKNKLDDLESYLSQCFVPILESDAWNSRYQQVFNNHIESETIRNIRNIINDCRQYVNYLEKTMAKYRRIDIYR